MIRFLFNFKKERFVFFVMRAKSVYQYQKEISETVGEGKMENIIESGGEEEFYGEVMNRANSKKSKILERIELDQQKEIAEGRINIAIRMLGIKLRQLIDITKERVEEERMKVKRGLFVESQELNMSVEEDVQNEYRFYLLGLLGEERDVDEWERIVEIAKENFFKKSGIGNVIFGEVGNEELKNVLRKNPYYSAYISGLIGRAKMLYLDTDPDLLDEYRNYVHLTVSDLCAGGNEKDFTDISKLITPELYKRRGFLNLPERQSDAMSGEEFFRDVLGVDIDRHPQRLGNLRGVERQNAIMEQIELGNIPSFLRRPKVVVVEGPDGTKIKTYAMPDYIAIGSDDNYVRVPITPALAQAFVKKYNLSLPTRTLVEVTYQQAGKKLEGHHLSNLPGFNKNLDTSGYYLRHNRDIQKQLAEISLGTLVAGHKKELVISRGSSRDDNERIHFYGLYAKDGLPIQRTAGHTRNWTEYALGVRCYGQMAEVVYPDGRKEVVRMDVILRDRADLAPIINRREWRSDDEVKLNYAKRIKEKDDGNFDPAKSYSQGESGLKMPHGPVV